MKAAATIAALAVGAVIAAASLWSASELHYRSCLTNAEVRGEPVDPIDAALDGVPSRSELADGCSRVPW